MKFDDEPSSSEEDDEPPLPPLAPQTKGLTKSPSQKNESEARGLASLNMNNFYFPGKKTFDDWTKFQLVTALVRDGQTIRDENYMSLGTVKSFAEAVFMDRPPPPKPKPYTLEEQTKRHHAALTIQNAYFTWMITALQNEGGATGEGNVAHMHDDILAAMHSNDTLAGERPHIPSESSFKRKAAVEQDPHQVNSQRELDLDSGLREDLEMMNDPTDDNSTAQNSILEEEFIPPSLEYAQLYADYNHPRLGGLGGKVMPWLRTSTGRHCHAGGWGEQCDLFEERQVSELGRYGPGITNYFKFLKWCFWIFVFMSAMWMPVLILNTFGTGEDQSAQLNDLAQTMVGNLGDVNQTKTLHLPGCTGSVRGQDCELDKEIVAQYYAFTDLIVTITVLFGYMWLRYYEVKESQLLDKNSLSAANYTISVKGFDTTQEVTAKDLKKHFKTVTGQDVAAVSIAYDNETEIELYKRRGELMMNRLRCTREYQYYRSKQRAGQDPVTHETMFDILARRVEITSAIRDIDRQTAKCLDNTDKPLYAFITFENAIAARLAVRAYNKSMWGYLRMKRSLMYKKARLSVAAAAEPSTIIWENLKYYKLERGRRRVVSTFVTLVLLAISAVANIIARGLEQNASSEGGDELCPEGFFDMTSEEQHEAIETNEDLLHCYCDQFFISEQTNDSYCSNYARQNIISDLFVYLAAFIVLCTNGAISLFLQKISAWYEKHHSQDSMEKSIFHRMFILKLINMGVLFLTMNIWAPSLERLGIVFEATQNFSTQWYKTIGVSMVLVQLGNIFGPHMYKLFFYRRMKKRQEKAVQDPINGGLTQIDLNKLFLGPDFLVAHRYAQNLADFFICFIFSAGMPILPFIAIFNFYTTYWVDKFLFLNYYRSPPRYKTNIGRSATALIPYALVLHLVASIWMLGNKEIFHAQTEDVPLDSFIESWALVNVHDKATQKHTYPLFVLFVMLVVGLLLSQIAEQIFLGVSSMIKTCCGSCMAKSDFYKEMEQYLFNTITIPYSRAVRRGIIKGLTNYNILQNPKYKEAFAITDVFAMNHSRVKSLRHFEKLSFDDGGDTEDDSNNNTGSHPASAALSKNLRKRNTNAGVHHNPDTLRLMNASLEMANHRASVGEGGIRGLEQIKEEGSGNLEQHERQFQLPTPSSEQRASYGPVTNNDRDDDNMSVMSTSTNVTRVTGVLLMDEPERPTSAMVDMGSHFSGGAMSESRTSSLHGNPMLLSAEEKKKQRTQEKGNGKDERVRRKSKPSQADQKHIDEFKERGSKGKTKGRK